jgi:hypothetical protein
MGCVAPGERKKNKEKTKEETVTQGMINRLINVGRCYGMDTNVGKLR